MDDDPVPQFKGGGPRVLVRNTFLDVDDAPAPEELIRATTAPPKFPGSPGACADSSDEELEGCRTRYVTAASQESNTEFRDANDDSLGGEAIEQSRKPGSADKENWKVGSELRSETRQSWGWTAQQNAETVAAPLVAANVENLRRLEGSAGDASATSAGTRQLAPVSSLGLAVRPTNTIFSKDGRDHAPCPQQLQTSKSETHPGLFRIFWSVDARKLNGSDSSAVSPGFYLSSPETQDIQFKLLLAAQPSDTQKGSCGFKKARGQGYVKLKCETVVNEKQFWVTFRVALATQSDELRDERRQNLAFKGPTRHNFSTSASAQLQVKNKETNTHEPHVFDFNGAVKPADQQQKPSDIFYVCLEMATGDTPPGYMQMH